MKTEIKIHDDYFYYELVRKNIKKNRKKAHLTQQELADKSGLSMHYISQIESEKTIKYFTLSVIGRIADVLEIDIRELFKPID